MPHDENQTSRTTWIDSAIGARLNEIRKQVGMTQEELGKIINISFQQIQKYEKGQNRISAARLYQIAKILQVPYDLFFTIVKSEQQSCLLGEESEPYNQEPLDEEEKKEILSFFEEIPSSRVRRNILQGLRDLSRSLRQ